MRAQRQVLFWSAAALVAVMLLMLLKDVLFPFIAGIGIAYALNPLADRLSRLGLPRLASSALIVAALVVLIVLALIFLVPLLVAQSQNLLLGLPGDIDRLRIMLEAWAEPRLGARYAEVKAAIDKAVADLAVNWASVLAAIAGPLWNQGRALVSLAALVLITPLVVFYLLIDWYPMLAKVESWLPREHEGTIRRLAGEMNAAISAFIRGQGLVCIVLGVLYAVALSGIGLRYGLLIGLATGVLSFVPFIGWALGLIVATSVAVVQFGADGAMLAKVVAVFAAGQALDVALLSPRIVGTKIGLHPVWLLVALAVFSYLFGLVGVLVAVPLAAAFAVLVRFALELYLASPIYTGVAKPDAAPGISAP